MGIVAGRREVKRNGRERRGSEGGAIYGMGAMGRMRRGWSEGDGANGRGVKGMGAMGRDDIVM